MKIMKIIIIKKHFDFIELMNLLVHHNKVKMFLFIIFMKCYAIFNVTLINCKMLR